MVDMMRKTMHSKLPVLPGMYDSSYRRDYRWHKKYQPHNKEKMQERNVASYSNNVDWRRREGLLAISIKASSRADDAGGRKPEVSASGPRALQQRKHATSVLPARESYPPKYHTATKLAATQAEKSEKPQALAELKNKPFYGSLLRRQKMAPNWAAYQQFVQKTYEATKHDARQNRDRILGSSVLMEECFDLKWRSTYNRDFQCCLGPYGEHRKTNKNFSHVFPEDDPLNQNDWVTEYEDSYSILSQRTHQLSQTPSAGLCLGLSLGKEF